MLTSLIISLNTKSGNVYKLLILVGGEENVLTRDSDSGV